MSFLIPNKYNGEGPDGRRTYFKGGSSGGGGTPYYANQDRLMGVQADIAQGVYNSVYQPYAPGAVADLDRMRKDNTFDSWVDTARGTAGADASMAMGQGLQAAKRQMDRYGSVVNPNQVAAMTQDAALQGAATKAGAVTKAGMDAKQWAEGQKWGRTYDFYNALSGVPSQTSQSLGSAAAGYGRLGDSVNSNNSGAAAGYGKAGALVGSALFAKTGGLVKKGELHLAAGGGVPGLPKINIGAMQRPNGNTGLSTGDAVRSFAAPVAMSAVGSGLKGALAGTGEAVGNVARGALGMGATDTEVAGAMKGMAGSLEAAGVTGDAAANAMADYGSSLAASTDAGLVDAGMSGLSSAAAAAAPWALGAMAVGSLLDLWADGGPVPKEPVRGRKDMRGGGKVKGPGTTTSDSIPARLSNGEYVLNAEAVKMIGKAKLEKWNRAGLMRRQGV